MTSGAIRVVVAHDSREQRRSILEALDGARDVTVVGECSDGVEARALIGDLVPDVALLALTLPKLGAVALCTELRASFPVVRVLLVGDEDSESSFEGARAGARGMIVLPAEDAQIVWAVRRVARGEGLMSPGWARAVLAELARDGSDPSGAPRPELSPTELEVVRRLASGATPEAIAGFHEVSTRLVNLQAGYTLNRVSRHDDDARTTGSSG